MRACFDLYIPYFKAHTLYVVIDYFIYKTSDSRERCFIVHRFVPVRATRAEGEPAFI